MNKIKRPLTAIAKDKNVSLEEVLEALLSSNIIYAHVENVTLTKLMDSMYFDAVIHDDVEDVVLEDNVTLNPVLSMNFGIIDLPINDMYLSIILSEGMWEGNIIQIISFDEESKRYDRTKATFINNISLSIKDLFVYQHEFEVLENERPCFFTRKPTVDINETPLQQKPPKSEITQEDAAKLVGVGIRTIRNWEKGKGTPPDYPGRQSRVSFMMFVASRASEKRFMKEARAINRAGSGGDMNEFSEGEKF